MRVLLIEDEPSVSSFIRKGLEEKGMLVVQAFDGTTGLNRALRENFDVIILDLIMPGLNGMEVCRRLREQRGYSTPVLMLTALGTTDDIVEGLNAGADDYLPKPFKFRELVARLQALVRRKQETGNLLKAADLVLNRETKEVFRNNKPVTLTAREYRLLEYLLINKNRVVSRADILENVWDVNHDLGTNVVDVYINYLRKKIDTGFSPALIKTIVGMGYALKDTERETQA
ncbi:MAG: response regulator transcription factor [Cyclobacteriaceae bacterium]|nr:response regulator transcription factor [Cyclobacteriaceae bacterium]MCX7638252.1 response regulator transcription factor [Cyclobacteriaceae bacterium]MDW8331514.1 response regulator transcription factor [Cyclobacteriaceae bacterium]